MIFPTEETAFEAFAGSLQEAAKEKGANMFTTKDPKQPESTVENWRVNREAATETANFAPSGQRLDIYGVCQKCVGKAKK